LIISFDTAFSVKSSADYSAFGVYGMFADKDGNFTGMMRIGGDKGHWSYPELKQKIIDQYLHHKPKHLVIEGKASGQSLLQDLILEGLPVMAYTPKADKEERANACVPFCEAGMIWVPEGDPKTNEFLDELFQFPSGVHDDYVDEFTQACLWMRDNMKLKLKSYGTIERNKTLEEIEDERDARPKQKASYWKATLRQRRY
jgi:predicted phage terminase large subunit-like protein